MWLLPWGLRALRCLARGCRSLWASWFRPYSDYSASGGVFALLPDILQSPYLYAVSYA